MSSNEVVQTLSANGATASISAKGHAQLHLSGTFGGGTATAQFKDTNGNWRNIAVAAYTTDVDKLIDLPDRLVTDLRVNLTGATSPSLVVVLRS